MDWEKFWDRFDGVVNNLFLMVTGITIFFLFMYFADSNITPITFVGNMMSMASYKVVAISHLDDNVSVDISNFCSIIPLDSQVECVVYQVMPFYNYSMHIDARIYGPDEYVMKGGVCRDSTVLYHSILTRMGWDIYYDFTVPHHVFLIATKSVDDYMMRCTIDGLSYDCKKYDTVV